MFNSNSGGGFSFGQNNEKKDGSTNTGGLFGGSSTNGTGLFGASGTTGTNTGTSSGTGIFGGSQPSGGLFTAKKDDNATATASSGGLFGTQKSDSASKPLFGQPAAASSDKPSGGLFGTSTASSSSTGGSVFGGTTSSTSDKPAFSFGTSSATPAATSTSTEKKDDKPGFSFGAKPTENKASGSLFGSSTSTAEKKDDKPTFAFGSNKDAKSDGDKPAAGGLFGSSSSSATSGSTGGLFGSANTEKQDDKPAFSFGGVSTSSSTNKDTKSADKPALSFGGATADKSAEKKDDKPAFSFGSSTSTSNTDKKEDKPAFTLGGAASTSTEKKDDKPAFSFGAKKEGDDTAKKPEGEKSTNAAPSTSFGAASTAKSTEITPSSYMRNKSFEDIISKWTSALTKSTTQFTAQAGDISKWDKILVENGTKISDTYSEVRGLEQKQARIDDLLNYIDGQQTSLEQMLDKYESSLDSDASTRFDHMQPADQERRNAYTLAENLNSRLDGLESSLASLVAEINKVSQDSNQIKDEDPIGPVLKILNSHLASMEWIEDSASQLQEKLQQVYSKNSKTRIPSAWS